MADKEPNCPECGKEMVRMPGMYGIGYVFFSGLVCCDSLCDDEEIDKEGYGEFMKFERAKHKKMMEIKRETIMTPDQEWTEMQSDKYEIFKNEH